MKVPRKLPRLFREPPRTLFDDPHYEAYEAPVKGPLFSNAVFYALLAAVALELRRRLPEDRSSQHRARDGHLDDRDSYALGPPDVPLQTPLLLYL
jgi:hypothetical protein